MTLITRQVFGAVTRRGLATSCSTGPSTTAASSLKPPVLWTYLPSQIPYHLALLLQETLVARRIASRAALKADNPPTGPKAEAHRRTAETDILLLLQHTPVYTTGRREKDAAELAKERARLEGLGADYVSTMRGGQTTYHGPGQLIGYSIMDIQRAGLSTRCYVDHLERFLANITSSMSLKPYPIEHTGVFLSPTSKIGSIGIHIRRWITLHGFSFNVQKSVLPWFNNIVACGLTDVRATSVESELNKVVSVESVVPVAVKGYGDMYSRSMRELTQAEDPELWRVIQDGVEGRLEPIKGL